MVEFFIQRHCPEDIIRTALQKVKTIPRQQTPEPNDKTATEKRAVISLVYHPSTNSVRKIIRSDWSLLQSRTELSAIFSQPPLIACKRDNNIREMLVRPKLRQPGRSTRDHSMQSSKTWNCPSFPPTAFSLTIAQTLSRSPEQHAVHGELHQSNRQILLLPAPSN